VIRSILESVAVWDFHEDEMELLLVVDRCCDCRDWLVLDIGLEGSYMNKETKLLHRLFWSMIIVAVAIIVITLGIAKVSGQI